MTAINQGQTHLDQDVQSLTDGFAKVVEELKAQAAAGQPLDFTKADALVSSVQTEATADAAPSPSPSPSPSPTPDPSPAPSPSPAPEPSPAPAPVGGLQPADPNAPAA